MGVNMERVLIVFVFLGRVIFESGLLEIDKQRTAQGYIQYLHPPADG